MKFLGLTSILKILSSSMVSPPISLLMLLTAEFVPGNFGLMSSLLVAMFGGGFPPPPIEYAPIKMT
jgi:hypothetical protein